MQRMVIVVAIALLASACATERLRLSRDRPVDVRRAGNEQPLCRDERPIGSMIVRHTCRSPEQRDDDEAFKESWAYRAPANPMHGDMTYPGVDARHVDPSPPVTYTTAGTRPPVETPPTDESKPAH
jgi:hypothetical protein